MPAHETVNYEEQLENQLATDEFFRIDDTGEETPVQPQDFTALLTYKSLQSISITERYWIQKPFIYAVICDIGGETAYFTVEPTLQDKYNQVKNELLHRLQRRLSDSQHDLELQTGTTDDKSQILNEVVSILNESNAFPDLDASTNPQQNAPTSAVPDFLPESLTEFINTARHTEFTVQENRINVQTRDINTLDKTTVQRIVYHVQNELLRVSDVEPLLTDTHITALHTNDDSDMTVTHDAYGDVTLHGGVKPLHW